MSAIEAEAPRGPDGWENWRAFLESRPATGEAWELSYYTDSFLVGAANDGLGPYKLLNTIAGGIGKPEPGAIELALVLRLDVHDDYEHVYRRTEWDKVDVSTYHGGAIGDELSGLLALVLGIRLRCGGTTRIFGADWTKDPRGAPGEFQHHRPSIVRPRRSYPTTLPRIARDSVSLPSAQDLLNTYPTLPRTDAIALVRAARQYEQAVWITDADPGVSWLQLVSAIEIAAVHWREYKKGDVVERLQTNAPRIAAAVEPAGDEIARAAAKKLAPLLRAKDRFRKFLAEFAPPPPEPRPTHAQLDWNALDDAFSTIYEGDFR
ncbi:MAG TPA: hypothetical protein VHI55_03060 [Gaiellaceae bacterium]|jgi:hypothetical protein|nr:hypothetical protein [Gaiellaceae bacterium]